MDFIYKVDRFASWLVNLDGGELFDSFETEFFNI